MLRARVCLPLLLASTCLLAGASPVHAESPPQTPPAAPPSTAPVAPQPPPGLSPIELWNFELRHDPELFPIWKKGRRQIISGALMITFGTLGGVIASAAFIDHETAGGAVFTVLSLGLLGGGIGLVAVGTGRQNHVKAIKPKPKPKSVALAPLLDPRRQLGGLSFALRF